MVVPGIMNNFIVDLQGHLAGTIVSLYELTGALGLALNSDANWRPFKIEGYLFIALIYFVFCFSMSRYSQWVEAVNKAGWTMTASKPLTATSPGQPVTTP